MIHRAIAGLRRRPIVVVLSVAAALRLVWAAHAARSVPAEWFVAGDQYSYWYYANEIAKGHGYASYITGRVTAYYPIGYPALLAVLYWTLAHTPLPDDQATMTALLHVALGTASVWFLYLIGTSCFSRRVGLLAASLLAVYPSSIFGVATFSLETAFTASALGVLAIVVTHDWSKGAPSWRRSLAIGVALGASASIRPFSLPILLGIALAFVVGRLGWRPALRTFAVIGAVVVAMFAPWTIRNYQAFDRFIPVSNNLGDTMCMSRFPGSNGGFSMADHEYCADPSMNEEDRNPANIRGALRFVREHPGDELLQIPRRLVKMFENDRSTIAEVESNGAGRFLGNGERRLLGALADLVFFVTVALAVAGVAFAVLRHRRRPEVAVVLTTAFFLLAIPLGLWGSPRFHAPLVPFIALFAALAVVTVIDRQRSGTAEVVDAEVLASEIGA